jgi:hypothetical protein
LDGVLLGCLQVVGDTRPCVTFSDIHPVETYVENKRIVRAGIPSAVFAQKYHVKNCSSSKVPVDDKITAKYSERTEVSFDHQLRREASISGGFEVPLFEIVKVKGEIKSCYSAVDTNRRSTITEHEVTSEKNVPLFG